MLVPNESWLLGARGLHHGTPPDAWERVGAREAPVLSICRSRERLLVGSTGGLWEVGEAGWIQRHDETLTEVLALAAVPGEPGVAAGCPYGVATPEAAPHGAWRWTFWDGGLSPDERFTNCLLPDPREPARLWVGTEAGLYVMDTAAAPGARVPRPTNLCGSPVRALLEARGVAWAATDTRGVWRSADGLRWRPAGFGLDEEGVFSLAADPGGLILAGTSHGVASGDGEGSWRIGGPRVLVSSLAVAPLPGAAGACWLAGASPGGLWCSTDRGLTWRNSPGHAYVRVLAAPSRGGR